MKKSPVDNHISSNPLLDVLLCPLNRNNDFLRHQNTKKDQNSNIIKQHLYYTNAIMETSGISEIYNLFWPVWFFTYSCLISFNKTNITSIRKREWKRSTYKKFILTLSNTNETFFYNNWYLCFCFIVQDFESYSYSMFKKSNWF